MKTLKKISLLFLPVLFLSCDLLFNKPDGDLMKDIEDSVWESNAPRLQVTMYYIDGAGTTNPAKGLVMPQPKQRIEFSVSFAANPEYGFVEWRAFYTGNRPENEQDWQEAAASLAGIVRFGSPRDLSTTVLVDSNSAHITLEPFCLRRPEVIRSDPMWTGSSSRFFTNQPIRIWFDMSIDPASVNDFNNISITGVTYQGTGTMVDLVKDRYFKPPALEEKGTMLLIKPDMDAFSEGILPNSDISIRLDINIRHDAFTEIDGGAGLRMTRPLTITYGTTGGPDKSVPQVLHVRGAQSEEDTVLFGKNDADPYTLHYRQNKAELYLLFNAYKPTETPIYDVTIYELPESAAEGTAYEVEELFWKAGGSLETLYSKVYESEYLEPPLTGTGRTKVKYRIRSETAGRVNLYILPEDMLGNKVTVADAKTQNFVMPVIIDPPPAPVTITQASYNRAEGGFELRWNPPAEPATPEGTVALEIEWKKNGNDITIPGSAIPADDPRFAAGIWNVPYISGDNEDQYTITVRALDGYENYSLSEPLTLRADTKPPAAATNLNVAHDRGARTITVTWADPAVPDLEYLRLSWATRDGSSTGEAKVPKGAKAYTLGNISNDSVYEFTLTAIDESGNESTPAVTGVNTGGGPVYVPPVSGLSAVYDAAARTITASWTNPNSSAFTGLSLAWNNGAGISGSADPGKAGSWTINGIANNSGVYTLTVTARNGAASSGAASATANTAYVPPVSGLSAAYNAGAQTITASWTNPNSSAFTGLSLAWNNGAGVSGRVNLGKENSTVITGIPNNSGVYTVTVTARNGTASAAAETVRVDALYVPPVTGLSAGYNGEAGTITASWTNPADAAFTGLSLAWNNGAGISGSSDAGKAGSWTITGIPNNTGSYTLTVTARNGALSSVPVTATANTAVTTPPVLPPPPPVTGLSAAYNAVARTITASWTNPADAAFTGLSLSWNNGAGISGSADPGKTGSWTINGIANNTGVYTLTVTARNGTVSSSPAAITADTAVPDPPGNSSITLIIDQGQGAFSQGTFTVSRSGSPQTQEVTVAGTDYVNPRWFVDGELKASGNSIEINAAHYGTGGHSLSLSVEMGGVPWSKAIDFTVTD